MTKNLSIVLVAAALTVGCLEGELEHVIYLDPDGSATWMVLEKEIRSASGDLAEEEKGFLVPYRNNEYHVAQALTDLGAVSVETRLLRPERPYWVVTTAEFVAIDAMLQRYVREIDEVAAEVWIECVGDERRLVVRYTPELDDGDEAGEEQKVEEKQEAEAEEEEDNVNILLDDELRIFLTSGKFVDAEGFEISHGGSVAVPAAVSEDDIDTDGSVTLSLTWTVEE
jgi:hypothetical protein